MRQQTRHAAIGELLEAEMDLLLQSREASRVASELFRPEILSIGENRLEILQGLLQSRDFFARLLAELKPHGFLSARSGTVAIVSIARPSPSLFGNAPFAI